MKISIITTTFNSAGVIADCIDSLNNQTYPNIEHIIIDGGSTDETLEIIRQKANQLAKIVSEPDKGVYEALNKGISLATGEIVGLLHSDDMFSSGDTIQHIAEVFDKDKLAADKRNQQDVVYGDLIFVDRMKTEETIRYWKSEPFKTCLLKRGWMPPHPTVFMHRDVYKKHGFFDTKLKCSADYDFILRVFSDDTLTFHYLPEVITKMRMGGISTKGFRQIIRKKAEDYRVLKHNRMPFPFWVLLLKSLTKIPQLMIKGKEAVLKVCN